jgi:hypothetical protein
MAYTCVAQEIYVEIFFSVKRKDNSTNQSITIWIYIVKSYVEPLEDHNNNITSCQHNLQS